MCVDHEEWLAYQDQLLESILDTLVEGEEMCMGRGADRMRYVRWRGEVRPATYSVKQVRAKKGRFEGTPNEIRPGDLVEVVTGFVYEPGDARLGYLPAQHRRIEKGPAWPGEVP